MSGLIGAAGVAGGANLLGSVLGFIGGQSTNAANARAVQQQIAFQQQSQNQAQNYATDSQAAQFNYDTVSAANQYTYNTDLMQNAQNYDAQQAQLARDWNTSTIANAQAYDSAQAQRQMDFQWGSQQEAERYASAMSNTAYQRGVADMKAAGINPILAAGGGGASSPTVGTLSGAAGSSPALSSPSPSSPGGSVGLPTVSAPTTGMQSGAAARFENPYKSLQEGLGGAVSSAASIYKLGNDLRLLQANVENTQADTLARQAQANQFNTSAGLNQANTAVAQQELINKGKQAGNIDADTAARLSSVNFNNAAAGASSAQAALSAAQRDYQLKMNELASQNLFPNASSSGSISIGGKTAGDTLMGFVKDIGSKLGGVDWFGFPGSVSTPRPPGSGPYPSGYNTPVY